MVMATLDRIPDAADPNSDSHWEYTTSYKETDDGDFVEVPMGVRPVLKGAASYIVGDYRPEWESPESRPSGLFVGIQMPLPEETSGPKPFRSRLLVFAASLLVLLILL